MRPRTSYLVCGTPRSGSSLLCEALSNTGIAGRPKEYFLPPHEPAMWQRWGTSSYVDAPEKAIEEGLTPNGVFGAKLMWVSLDGLVESLRRVTGHKEMPAHELLSTFFPNLHYIWITRSDKLRQAISEWKAIQTDAWFSWEERPDKAAPKFSYFLISELLGTIMDQEAAWIQFFTANGIRPLVVVYEDLVLSYEATTLRVLDYLKIELPENLVFPEPRLKKQADAVSDEWAQRYLHLTKWQRRLGTILSLPYILRKGGYLRRHYIGTILRAKLGRYRKARVDR